MWQLCDAAVKELSVVKIIVDEIDEEKLYYKYSVIEGGNPNYESTSYTYKFELSEDGGCLCKLIGEFKTIGDYEPTDQDKVLSKEGFITTFMAIDAYLQANPNECAWISLFSMNFNHVFCVCFGPVVCWSVQFEMKVLELWFLRCLWNKNKSEGLIRNFIAFMGETRKEQLHLNLVFHSFDKLLKKKKQHHLKFPNIKSC